MKFLTIATVVAMIALLPGYSHAMASRHHHEEGGAGPAASGNAAGSYAAGSYGAPISVPEPGTLLLLTSGATALGGLLAGKWYGRKKREKRSERHEP